MRKNYIDASKSNLEKIRKMRANEKVANLSNDVSASSFDSSENCEDVSKINLKKIKEIRESGKIQKLESEIKSCSANANLSDPPIPIWYPKQPTKIRVENLPRIPTYKIIGSFDASSEITIDGGSP